MLVPNATLVDIVLLVPKVAILASITVINFNTVKKKEKLKPNESKMKPVVNLDLGENHSCESALQVTITEWKQKMDIGYYTIAVYLDLKRAFETIDRGILIEKIYHYGVKSNKLKLNISKTKAMLISTPYKYKQINLNEITLTIDSTRIEIVEETKYLGLVIDSHLNFIPHFNYIHKKISKKNLFLLKGFTKFKLITVYNTIIKTHFEYCATVLFSLDLNKMLALQKLQNRAMRIILKCNRYTPISNMLSCLQWLNNHLPNLKLSLASLLE
ncbi:hypothetical protein NQ317_018434 [Molorchus minor]|uniref:Reverse transcriptase domain-containing protein n=1 Tax=Molorchus minor TaxID=1323400 RepID=A0ABQ9JPS4_9CUCU|nr:hypothetical protein NQ317_018434 [Molorchus minor]